MTDQLTLPVDAPAWLERPTTDLEARFREFHAANPHIYRELERRAFRLLGAGASRIGVKAMWEAMRYDAAVRTDSRNWKLDNSLTSLYARLLIHRNPALSGVIETRRRSA